MESTTGAGRAAGLDESEGVNQTAGARSPRWARGFSERLIGGIVLLTLILIAMATWFYLTPGDYLQTPELQAALRVTREGQIPLNGSRVVTWGPRTILIVRYGEHDYAAVSGVSPIDGCILRWDAPSLRVVSPCSFVVYGLDGSVVRGNTMVPLDRYTVFLRHDEIYVTGP